MVFILETLKETLRFFSEGNKKLYISILVVLSCFCTSTLYYFVVFREVFIEIEFLRLILLIVSTGVTSFLIFMLGMFISFAIAFSISKKDSDPYIDLLLLPAMYNFAYYLILILRHEKDLMTLALLLMAVSVANVVVFGLIRGFEERYKEKKR